MSRSIPLLVGRPRRKANPMPTPTITYHDVGGISYVKIGTGPRVTAVLGGVHGNEIPSVLSPGALVRQVMFRQVPRAMGAALKSDHTILVVAHANPEACALTHRLDGRGGDLNYSWPGMSPSEIVEVRGLRFTVGSRQSPESVARGALLADFMRSHGVTRAIGFHAERCAWRAYTTSGMGTAIARVAPRVEIVPRHETMGLPAWCASHGIEGADLEAPMDGEIADAAAIQARIALDIITG